MITNDDRRFAYLLTHAQAGYHGALTELEKYHWQPHIDTYRRSMPDDLSLFAIYEDKLWQGLTAANEALDYLQLLDALHYVSFIVERILSRADQQRFAKQFNISVEGVRDRLTAAFRLTWQQLRDQVRNTPGARAGLVQLYKLAHSAKFKRYGLEAPTAKAFNDWLVRTVIAYELQPHHFVGDYLPTITAQSAGDFTLNAIAANDPTLAVWVYCSLVHLQVKPAPGLVAIALRAYE